MLQELGSECYVYSIQKSNLHEFAKEIYKSFVDILGNPNDKILYPRIPCPRIRSGYSTERLERRHSLRFFGHGRRSHSLQRTGSVRHITDKNERVQHSKELSSPDDVSSKCFLFVLFVLFCFGSLH